MRLNITGAAHPHLDLKENGAQRTMRQASAIVTSSLARGVSGADLFVAFAAMLGAQNPRLVRLTLDALEKSIADRDVVAPDGGKSTSSRLVDSTGAPIQ